MPNPIALIFLNHTLSELGTYGHSPFAVILNGGLFFWQLKSRLLLFVFVTTGDIFLGISLFYQSGMHFFSFSERGIISGERVSLARFRAEMVFLSGKFKCDFLLSFSFFRQVSFWSLDWVVSPHCAVQHDDVSVCAAIGFRFDRRR